MFRISVVAAVRTAGVHRKQSPKACAAAAGYRLVKLADAIEVVLHLVIRVRHYNGRISQAADSCGCHECPQTRQ